ncbi:hypothetical protein [Halocatena marina]|uniref:PH domain-containing protein n=1 Tax=Halocatena marina TaxID=2934937 RepID=A0ABD5YQ65_9EURY|nr:hypothetical protein [Halocatena marina]
MLIWSREINADEIDAWIIALRSEGDWGIELEAVARTTLLAMAASDNTYTGKDLYRVFHSPMQRQQFVAAEKDEMTVSGRSVNELATVDETTYSMLASRTLSCHRS